MFKNPQPEAITKGTTLTHSSKPMLGDSKTFKEITNGLKGIRHMDP